jgi:hypothetical protein
MDERDLTPFRIAKHFEEHVPQVLESLSQDPDGMYQVVYRVGDLMISAQVWREPPQIEVCPHYSEADQEFLRKLNISTSEDIRV